jgi:LmbE family N-acetylglucosaminyl deacetylase
MFSFGQRRELRAVGRCRRLMVVAHPDDETLWGGITLASTTEWGVICLTNRSNRARRAAFATAMRLTNCKGVVLDIPDRREQPVTSADFDIMRSLLAPMINSPHVEQVMTHGPEGEYGHQLHRAVSQFVTTIIDDTDRLFVFNFDAAIDVRVTQPDAWALKQSALIEYLGPPESMVDSDYRHYLLSTHESPVRMSDFVRPTTLLKQCYDGSDFVIG